MIDNIHDVLSRVQRIAEQDITIVSTQDAVAMSREIALLRSAHGGALIRAEEAEKTRDAAYRERSHLVALLAAQHPSVIAHRPDPKPTDDDWPCVYITLPTGQASWHVHPDDLDLFEHVTWMGYSGVTVWDGHDTAEKYQRVDALTAQIAAGEAADQ